MSGPYDSKLGDLVVTPSRDGKAMTAIRLQDGADSRHYVAETVREDDATEVVRRWNAYTTLLAFAKRVSEAFADDEGTEPDDSIGAAARKVIAEATGARS